MKNRKTHPWFTPNIKSRRNLIILALPVTLMTAVALQSSAATHYVSQTSPYPAPPYSTPQTAAHNIQDAVDVTIDGDTVLVAPGDYAVTNQVNVTNAVRLQSSGGANQTFLTGYGAELTWCLGISNVLAAVDGFSFRPATAIGFPGGVVLVGGTIQNCNFTNFYAAFSGGSIAMSGGIVSNVIVRYNRAPDPQGATVYCSDSGLITDSQVLANPAFNRDGGGIILVNGQLQNSIISGAPGAGNISGVAVSAYSSTVVDCIISNNFSIGQGGGAYLEDSVMDRCVVTGNIAASFGPGSGGGGIFETNSIIRDSLIISNRAVEAAPYPDIGGNGAGVYMQGGALLNCTVVGNSADEYVQSTGGGGGVFAEGGGITNCIIFFNSINGDRSSSNWFNLGPAIFDHCCTAPNPGGLGNITQDPQFVSITGDDHLVPSSPCIGAGVVQSWMTGAQDLDRNPRTAAGRVDMGAYERPATTPQGQAQDLITEVNSLTTAGTLPRGNANALLASLRAAINSIDRGNGNAACGQLAAFVGKVQSLIGQHQLNQGSGQGMISSANDLRSVLGCGNQ